MKQHISFATIITSATVLFSLSGVVAAQGLRDVASLRGAAVDEPVAVEEIFHPDERRFNRNYRQQPPLIPHAVDQYQIDTNANRCLSCHDWSRAGDRNAPTLSMTHYLDREGRELDSVAGTRWFCNQCHVPQANAPALVENTFRPSTD